MHVVQLLMTEKMECFDIKSSVRGYHIYKDIWEASVGEELPCQRKNGNCANPFAVAKFLAKYFNSSKNSVSASVLGYLHLLQRDLRYQPINRSKCFGSLAEL